MADKLGALNSLRKLLVGLSVPAPSITKDIAKEISQLIDPSDRLLFHGSPSPIHTLQPGRPLYMVDRLKLPLVDNYSRMTDTERMARQVPREELQRLPLGFNTPLLAPEDLIGMDGSPIDKEFFYHTLDQSLLTPLFKKYASGGRL